MYGSLIPVGPFFAIYKEECPGQLIDVKKTPHMANPCCKRESFH